MSHALGFEELQATLDHVTYRPGWELTLRPKLDDDYAQALLVIDAVQPDSRDPAREKTVELHIMTAVPPTIVTIGQFFAWLRWRIEQVELHEVKEWLQYDGKPLEDPHTELRPAT